MTRERDIERVLDAWFESGPNVMPDRLFDDVLGRVAHLPQRGALPSLRSFRTDSGSRWLGLAVAAIVVAVVGLTAFSRPTDQSAGDSALPEALRGRWAGPPKAIQARAEVPFSMLNAASVIEIGLRSFTFQHAGNGPGGATLLRAASTTAGDGRIRLDSADGGAFCGDGDSGLYRWSVSPGGLVLTISEPTDDCQIRADTLAGTWWKVGCQIDGGTCLGKLEAGTYSSQFFDPFYDTNNVFVLRFGALSYSVPDGWSNDYDWSESFKLWTSEVSIDSGIFLTSDVVVVSQEDPCLEMPSTTVGRTAQEMTDWLTTASGVVASSPIPVTIGGLSGSRLDVSLDPAWTESCGVSEVPTRILFSNSTFGAGTRWALEPEVRMRVFLLDIGDGRTLAVIIRGETQTEYDALVDVGTSVVESFEFHRP